MGTVMAFPEVAIGRNEITEVPIMISMKSWKMALVDFFLIQESRQQATICIILNPPSPCRDRYCNVSSVSILSPG